MMDLQGRKIAVTGATGFIGRHLVEALQRRGAEVIAVVRNPAKLPAPVKASIEVRIADLSDMRSLTDAFRNTDAVISNAALFSMGNTDWKAHRDCNVTGTLNVIRAIADAGVARAIHVSSVAVYRAQGTAVVSEDCPLLTEDDLGMFNAYSVSKALSEREAWKLADELGLTLSCCRPSAVFGPFDPNVTPSIARLMSRSIAPLPRRLRIGLVYAGDVAEGTVRILEHGTSAGKSYNLTGPHVSSGEFLDAWRQAGGPWPKIAVPVPVPFTRLWDNSLAERELGWSNRPYRDTLKETFSRQPWGDASWGR